MKTCEYAGEPFAQPRAHPWTDAAGNAAFRYYDLTACPEHIRRSLEDFRPWSHYAAIEDFYALLEWINQPGSVFESNDCAFCGPSRNPTASVPKLVECSGRVMLLFRALERNTVPDSIEQLKNALHGELIGLDRDARWGVIGTTLVPVRFLALPLTIEGDAQLGWQLMVSFWAWGDAEADCMQQLQRLLKSLSIALRNLSTSG